MTLRINRTLCVSRYIRHRPITRMREQGLATRAGSGEVMLVLSLECFYGSPSKACVIIKLAVFRRLSGDDASSTYLVVYHTVQ